MPLLLLYGAGTEVVYLERLVEESILDEVVKGELIEAFLKESKNHLHKGYSILREYLDSLDTPSLVKKLMEGVLKKDINHHQKLQLDDLISAHYPFYIDPLPNLYFTRDAAAVIGEGLTIHKMSTFCAET